MAQGDPLSWNEFASRYHELPGSIKAELIEGVVHMSPPVRYRSHGESHSLLHGWLFYYVTRTPGLDNPGDNCTVRLGDDNGPQPDLFLLLPPEKGLATIDQAGYVVGAPALVCEIASSTANTDLDQKKRVYQSAGVQEYIVWQSDESVIDWFYLVGGQFRSLVPNADGLLHSRVFPGLWMNPQVMVAGDKARMLQILEQGTSTPEHVDFVRSLSK